MRISGPMFQHRLRGPHIEGLPQDDDRACTVFVGTALFSFEGTAPRLLAIRSSFVMRSPAATEFDPVP